MSYLKIIPTHKPLKGKMIIPGSKSYTNRALIIAALADGVSEIMYPLICEDTRLMIGALKNLGVPVQQTSNSITVQGTSGAFHPKKKELFCGLAGTTSRFLTALSSLIPEEITITGEGKLLERPIGDLVDALRQIGVSIQYVNKEYSIPLKINAPIIKTLPRKCKLKGSISSQFLSALLLIAPKLKNGLHITLSNPLISKSYVDMTIQIMKDFGVDVVNTSYKEFEIKPQIYQSRRYVVEGDWSSASYFFAIAALHPRNLVIKNLKINSLQGDSKFPKLLETMGVKILYNANGITISGGNTLKPVTVDMETMPDSALTLAILAGFADGTSVLSGLQSLKNKESDRLSSMQNELKKIGVGVEIQNNSFIIHGNRPHGARIQTYNDHRIAMSFAVAGSKISGITIENPGIIVKSFPSFWEALSILGIQTTHET